MHIVITGSTQGIGLGLAKEFLKKGHDVLINGRNTEKTEAVCSRLNDRYPENTIIAYSCDVVSYPDVDKMYLYACEKFGSVDIWINNAGMDQKREYVWEQEPEMMHRIVDVNIKGVLNGTRVASERMRASGGFIYNMEGYGSNDMMGAKMSIYGMTKRALTYYTLSAAKEVSDTQVKICLLSPGMVVTDLLLSSLPEDPEKRKKSVKFFHILADRVEVVTAYLVEGMLKNQKNGIRIAWLTKRKIMIRFLSQIVRKRRLEGLE